MRKNTFIFLSTVLILSLILFIFFKNHIDSKTNLEENYKELTDEEIYNIVINNLNKMESRMLETYDERLGIRSELIYLDNVPKEIGQKIENTKYILTDLVSKNYLDDWAKFYLYDHHVSNKKSYLNVENIHTRFKVIEKNQTQFKVSFLSISKFEDDNIYATGTMYLTYIFEDNNWVLDNAEYITATEEALNLSFDDLEEYYFKFEGINSNFNSLEEVEHEGEKYLIYELGEDNKKFFARNVKDSTFNQDILKYFSYVNVISKNEVEESTEEDKLLLENYDIYEIDYARIILMAGPPRLVEPIDNKIYVKKYPAGEPVFNIEGSPNYPENITYLFTNDNYTSNHDVYSMAFHPHGDGHITLYPQPSNFEISMEPETDEDYHKLANRILEQAKVMYVDPSTPEKIIEFIEKIEFVYE